jgi:predicted site-specific integrase-resolvase
MQTETPYVPIEDVAKHFSVSLSTVRGWVRTGTIPPTAYIKLGYIYRFNLPSVASALMAASDTEKKNDNPTENEGE